MKKVVGVFVCMLLIGTIVPVSSNIIIDNEKEILPCNFEEMFTVRVEIEKINKGIWKVKAFAKNRFDYSFHVEWPNGKPFTISYFYKVPDEDKHLYVFSAYKGFFGRLFNPLETEFDFGPYEEKMVQSGYFFGFSNMIGYGINKGYKDYIPDFPWLPEGEYLIQASLNAYRIGTYCEGTYERDSITFYYDRLE